MLPTPPTGPDMLRELSWPVIYNQGALGYIFVRTDPEARQHIITLPAPGSAAGPLRWIEVQHEFVHCLLAERCHHLFSAAKFAAGASPDLLTALTPIFQVAGDWFVDEILFQRWPDAERAEVIEHLRLLTAAPLTSPDLAWGAALMLAQARRYKCSQAAKRAKKLLPPEAGHCADILMAVDPAQPTVANLQRLLNSMLRAATLGRLSLTLTTDADLEVWKIQ